MQGQVIAELHVTDFMLLRKPQQSHCRIRQWPEVRQRNRPGKGIGAEAQLQADCF
jgi:hypothetical protein